jgi:hypothetical protein
MTAPIADDQGGEPDVATIRAPEAIWRAPELRQDLSTSVILPGDAVIDPERAARVVITELATLLEGL